MEVARSPCIKIFESNHALEDRVPNHLARPHKHHMLRYRGASAHLPPCHLAYAQTRAPIIPDLISTAASFGPSVATRKHVVSVLTLH